MYLYSINVYIAESLGYLTGSELAETEFKSWKW